MRSTSKRAQENRQIEIAEISSGLKATAKVYGERVPFVYSLLRRPLSALRRQLGW